MTDRGRSQVEELAQQLSAVKFAAFYCSPMRRARQSADILSARLGIDPVITPALAEYDVGELEGRSDAESWQRYYALIDVWIRDRDWTARIAGGESFDDIRARFLPFIARLLESPTLGPDLLLGHGGTFRCMLPLILSNVTVDLAVRHAFDNSSIVVAEHGPGGLVCTTWKGRPVADWVRKRAP